MRRLRDAQPVVRTALVVDRDPAADDRLQLVREIDRVGLDVLAAREHVRAGVARQRLQQPLAHRAEQPLDPPLVRTPVGPGGLHVDPQVLARGHERDRLVVAAAVDHDRPRPDRRPRRQRRAGRQLERAQHQVLRHPAIRVGHIRRPAPIHRRRRQQIRQQQRQIDPLGGERRQPERQDRPGAHIERGRQIEPAPTGT